MKLKIRRPKTAPTRKPATYPCALLVGNDINNVVAGFKWSELVEHLVKLVSWPGDSKDPLQPFPLIYEQIYLYGLKTGKLKMELDLKEEIAEWAEKIQHSDIHRGILDLGAEDIMTTNYDFCIENAARTEKPRRDDAHDESVYSLYRYYHLGQHRVWHLHGDVSTPRSINLGYEQYSGTLHRMRDYVILGGIRKNLGGSLIKRLGKGPIEVQSWLDLFFTRNIYIFGIRLDQVEMHLWWLLDYRARRIAETRKGPLSKRSRFCPKNRVVYYYPKALLRDKVRKEPLERRINMLNAFGVETVGRAGEPGTAGYYRSVLKSVSEDISERS
jgi:hypothetical protein